jgi:sugar phosphate isomerase/epimerase
MASDLSSIPTSFATCSIGADSDPLEKKLKAIASGGFQGIELSFPDLLTFASSYHKKDISESDYNSLCEAGKEVKKLCADVGLKIVMLQPFANYEGWPEGSKEKTEALERAKGWIQIMEVVGTDMLQVGSSDSPSITSDRDQLAKDLGVLADMLAEKGFRLAYENWCWCVYPSTYSLR